MGLSYFADIEGSWDRLQLGPQQMPGIWEVGGEGCRRDIDRKKSKGKDGARVTDKGAKLAHFTLTGRMISEEDWEILQQVLPTLTPKKKGGTASPLSVFHPAIAILGVTTVYIDHVAPPRERDGILEIQIDVVEWTAAPKVTKSKAQVDADQRAANASVTGGSIRLPSEEALSYLGTSNTVSPGFTFG